MARHFPNAVEEFRRVLARQAVVLEGGFQVYAPAEQTELVHLGFLALRVELLSYRAELVPEVSSLQVLRNKSEQNSRCNGR